MTFKEKLNTSFQLLVIAVIIVAILDFGQTLFVPLSFALLISFILYPLCRWLQKHGLGKVLAILLGISFIFILLAGIIFLFVWRLIDFSKRWPELQTKFINSAQKISLRITELFDITSQEQTEYLRNALENLLSFLPGLIQQILYTSSVSLVLVLLIPVYVFLMLFYRQQLVRFLYTIFPDAHRDKVTQVLQESIMTYYNFIKGMAIVYLIVGVLNSLGLFILGIPNPLFFGLIASVLTFIPYVGIIIGASIPVALAWINSGSIWSPLAVVAMFVVVQVIEANLIFPLAVGNRLQINALVSIIVIIAGGLIWGASGMILFMPFAAIFKLIADKTESLRPVSTLMGT